MCERVPVTEHHITANQTKATAADLLKCERIQ
jgi:hypothetical protein